jgi:tetratricopeptide (TPR) repeat protein
VWGWGLHAAVPALLLVLLVVLAFYPCLGNAFVQWDDDQNFLENTSYRGLGWAQIRWDWTSFRIGVYQPLAWMILGVQYLLFKLKPWGYHLFSLVFHAINTVVLFVLTVAVLARFRPGGERQGPGVVTWSAALATALFAVHPLRTEVVAWASCQPYLPCALFLMLSVLAYLHALPDGQAPRGVWVSASFFLFAAALLCKAVAVTLPAVLLILDVYPLRRLGGGQGRWFGPAVRRVWWEKLAFALLSLIFVILAVVGRAKAEHLFPTEVWGLPERVAQACFGIWFYLIKTVLPVDLTAFYVLPRPKEMFRPRFVLSILGVVSASAGLFLLRRRPAGTALLAVWLSYVVILVPNLGLVRIGSQIAADRYTYVAMIGGVVLLAAGLCQLLCARPTVGPVTVGLAAASLAVVSGLMVLTQRQCRTWRTTETLWTHVLTHGGSGNGTAHNNLGVLLKERGRVHEARIHFEEALRLAPKSGAAHTNLGSILKDLGRTDEARAHFNEALRLEPNSATPRCYLALLLFGQGRTAEARAQLEEAVRINPDSVGAHNGLGLLLYRQGRMDEAQDQVEQALRINPESVEAHTNLGSILKDLGRTDEARAHFNEALRINPDSPDAHCLLGLLLLGQGRSSEARAQIDEAVRLNPDSVDTHNGLGLLLYRQGQMDEAQAQAEEALRINRQSVDAHCLLGLLLLDQGRSSEARARINEALRINPESVEAHNELALLLYRQGRIDEAQTQVAEALRINPASAEALTNLGVFLKDRGRMDESRAQFNEALRIHPEFAEAHSQLGLLLLQQGRIDEARAQVEDALRINPGDADAHNKLGLILARGGRFEEAAAHFREALGINPNYRAAHSNLGLILLQQGRIEEAGAQFEEAVRIDPGSVEARSNLGAFLSGQGRIEEALAQFDEALRLNPSNAQVYRNQAMIWAAGQAKYRDGRRAVEAATRACALTEWKNPAFLDTCAAAHAEAGDFDAAVRWQSRAIDLLTDENQKADFRSRLELYQARKPYREPDVTR